MTSETASASDAATPPAFMLVVAITNRALRLALTSGLERAGVRVRPVSRAAELVKALHDGTNRVVVTSDHADDTALTSPMRASARVHRWIVLGQQVTVDAQLAQIHEALADEASASGLPPGGDDQATSNA